MATIDSPKVTAEYWTRGLDINRGCPSKTPVSVTPKLMMPSGTWVVSVTRVGAGRGVEVGGTAVGWAMAVGSGVSPAIAVGCGAMAVGMAVGAGADVAVGTGVEVAEEPQAATSARANASSAGIQSFEITVLALTTSYSSLSETYTITPPASAGPAAGGVS